MGPVAEVEALVLAVDPAPGIGGAEQQRRDPPNASANGPTNGMVPPTPMYTGSTPNASRSARSVASNAGPVGSQRHAGTASSGSYSQAIPNGTRRATWAARAALIRAGS